MCIRDSSQSIAFGATGAAVTAVPAPGYTFAYWSGLPGGRVRTATLPLPNVTCPMNVAAVFTPDPTTYVAWRAASFFGDDLTNDAVSGPAADPDNAGVTNLQRYAFSLAARGPVAPPTILGSAMLQPGPQKFLTISFDRRPTGSDLRYFVEASPDLATWTLATPAPLHIGTPTKQVIPDLVPMDNVGASRRFLRVRVQYAP